MSATPTLTITDTRLIDALELVRHAAATDAMRPILHAIHVKAMRKRKTGPADAIRFEAADNYRVAHVTLPIEPVTDAYAVTPGFDLVLDLDMAAMLLKWLGKPKFGREVTATLLGNAVYFKRDGLELQLPRVDGTYPDTAPLIDPASVAKSSLSAWKKPKKPFTVCLTGELFAQLCKALAEPRKGVIALTFDAADPMAPIRVTGDRDKRAGEVIMPVRSPQARAVGQA